MSHWILNEKFETHLDENLAWFCPPANWTVQEGRLEISPDAQTDFWQRTHYGFQNDNGHFLFAEVMGDFVLTAKVNFYPKNQYDQAGLMVRLSPDFWLKTSIEYEPEEPNRLGAVVTRHGFSDWSTQDIAKSVSEYQLRIRREADDYVVEYRGTENDHWSQIRMAHLEKVDQTPVQCGLYACSPIAAGFRAQFEYLRIEKPA